METTENTEFTPSIDQILYLKAWLDPETPPTRAGACARVFTYSRELSIKLSYQNEESLRNATYRWDDDPGYIAWWNKEYPNQMARNEKYLDSIGLKKAVEDFRYWEAMQIKYANYKRKSDITSNDEPIAIAPSVDVQSYADFVKEQNKKRAEQLSNEPG